VTQARFLLSHKILCHEGILKKIAPAARILQLLEYTMCPTQTKNWKIACTPLIMKVACGAFVHNTYNIQFVTYHKLALLVVLDTK